MVRINVALLALIGAVASAQNIDNTNVNTNVNTNNIDIDNENKVDIDINLADVVQVVPSYVTYLPAPTNYTNGNKTYVVTSATTLTVTDCPCTITTKAKPYPVVATTYLTSYVTYCPSATAIVAKNTTYYATAGQTVTVSNGLLPIKTTITLTPGQVATGYKAVGQSVQTYTFTPGPKAAVTPNPGPANQPPKPTAAAFTGAAARNEILGLPRFGLW